MRRTVARDPRFDGERNPKRAKDECNAGHDQQVYPVSDKYRQDHWSIWDSKHFSMYQLPSIVLLYILREVNGVVPRYIL